MTIQATISNAVCFEWVTPWRTNILYKNKMNEKNIQLETKGQRLTKKSDGYEVRIKVLNSVKNAIDLN